MQCILRNVNLAGCVGTYKEGVLAGEFLILSSDSQVYVGYTTAWTKCKEVNIHMDGIIRVRYLIIASTELPMYGMIRVNDVEVGTLRYSTTETTYTEDIDVHKGDNIQIYCKHANANYAGGSIAKFRLYIDTGTFTLE